MKKFPKKYFVITLVLTTSLTLTACNGSLPTSGDTFKGSTNSTLTNNKSDPASKRQAFLSNSQRASYADLNKNKNYTKPLYIDGTIDKILLKDENKNYGVESDWSGLLINQTNSDGSSNMYIVRYANVGNLHDFDNIYKGQSVKLYGYLTVTSNSNPYPNTLHFTAYYLEKSTNSSGTNSNKSNKENSNSDSSKSNSSVASNSNGSSNTSNSSSSSSSSSNDNGSTTNSSSSSSNGNTNSTNSTTTNNNTNNTNNNSNTNSNNSSSSSSNTSESPTSSSGSNNTPSTQNSSTGQTQNNSASSDTEGQELKAKIENVIPSEYKNKGYDLVVNKMDNSYIMIVYLQNKDFEDENQCMNALKRILPGLKNLDNLVSIKMNFMGENKVYILDNFDWNSQKTKDDNSITDGLHVTSLEK